MGNHWFAITGSTVVNDDPQRYMYFDDVSLFRQCDIDSACFRPTGQICPVFATPGPPGPPMVIKQIDNANRIQVKIYNQLAQVMIDTAFFNPNGLPDFYFQPAILSGNVASGNYPYDVTLHNKCGGVRYTGQFQVLAGIYDTLGPWVDTTATWSEVPVPCCLSTLTLSDIELNGHLCYMVRDTIWVEGGVSAAPGSNILIQAGQVVELDSVEFDGTNTVVEILEAPCQGCRMAPSASNGTPPDPREIGTNAVITASGSQAEPKGRTNAQSSQISAHEPVENLAEHLDNEAVSLNAIALRAYPNPFYDAFTLEVKLPQAGPASLTVYDLRMRPVSQVADGSYLSEGVHSFRVGLGQEAPGIYFVQLVSGGVSVTEKLVKR